MFEKAKTWLEARPASTWASPEEPVITEAMISAGDRVVAEMFDGRPVKTRDLAAAIYRAMWRAMS